MSEKAALAYAARGWPVFPCDAEKRPLTAHGFKDAAAGADAVRRLWGGRPDCNVAISAEAAGLVVIDVDVKAGAPGLRSWQALVGELGASLEETATAKTPSGGLHFYYRAGDHAVGSSVGKLAPGVDVRARGGYVVAPPSTDIAGVAYEWLLGRGPECVASLPSALAERLVNQNGAGERRRLVPASVMPQGTRNSCLASLAGSMRCRGMSEAAIVAALLQENSDRCDPPLPDDEVRAIAASVASYPPSPGDVADGDRLARLNALSVVAGPAEIEAALREAGRSAASLDALARETLRERAIAVLKTRGVGSPARLVDAAFSVARAAEDAGISGGGLLMREVEAWPEAVGGPRLLGELAEALRRHVVLDEEACLAVALWIVLAHCYESHYTPSSTLLGNADCAAQSRLASYA